MCKWNIILSNKDALISFTEFRNKCLTSVIAEATHIFTISIACQKKSYFADYIYK